MSGRSLPRPESRYHRGPRYRWAGRIGAGLLRLWGRSWRVEWDRTDRARELIRSGAPYIHAFWHEHILPLAYAHRDRGVIVLVSESADGEYISQIIHRLGLGTVRGSSSRGGVRALLAAARHGREGHALAVTPDGPRGPRRRLQPGLLEIGRRSGLPIVPLSAGMRRGRRLAGWDRFQIPAPFARILIAAGDPIRIPPEADLAEPWSKRVEAAMNALERKVEAWEQHAGPEEGSANRDERSKPIGGGSSSERRGG